MNCCLTCKDVISGMDARTNLIPKTAAIFVAVLFCVSDHFSIYYFMWTAFWIFIIKRRFTFFCLFNPGKHVFCIGSKVVINILFITFDPMQNTCLPGLKRQKKVNLRLIMKIQNAVHIK